MAGIGWTLTIIAVALAVLFYAWWPMLLRPRRKRFHTAQRCFHVERERLEAKFVALASAQPNPDGPRWADCSFADDVAYARNRSTGELTALVAVTIATEHSSARSHRRSDAVGNLQAGTAMFRFDGKHWLTDGRAILNLSPTEAIHRFRKDLEMVAEELATHR